MTQNIATPFHPESCVVRPEWIDYNGHMNIGYYLVAFDNACESFFHFIGLTPEFRKRHGSTTFALESHLNYLREVNRADPLRFEARLLDFDAKRLHFYVEMFHASAGYLAASFESLSSHVTIALRKTTPMPVAPAYSPTPGCPSSNAATTPSTPTTRTGSTTPR